MRLRVLKLQKNTRCLIGSILFYILSISLLFSLHFEINIDETQEIGVGLSVEEKKTENEQKHIMMSPQSAAGTSGLLSNFLNTSETCYQQIDWGAAIDGNIEVPTPSEFNSTQLSIDVKVMNATKTTQNIETTTSGTRILEEVAQAFVLPEDCFLTELSIFVAGGQPATRSFEIRKDSPDGETLTSFSASLTDSIWTNLTQIGRASCRERV